jgi:hypothetical protein
MVSHISFGTVCSMNFDASVSFGYYPFRYAVSLSVRSPFVNHLNPTLQSEKEHLGRYFKVRMLIFLFKDGSIFAYVDSPVLGSTKCIELAYSNSLFYKMFLLAAFIKTLSYELSLISDNLCGLYAG